MIWLYLRYYCCNIEFIDLVCILPRLGERIAFRALEILEDYSPGLSAYKEAEVVESEGASITLWVKDVPRRLEGKFEVLGDVEDEGEMHNFVKTYSWSELVRPKLIVLSREEEQ